jgi:hypothetical protein
MLKSSRPGHEQIPYDRDMIAIGSLLRVILYQPKLGVPREQRPNDDY